MRPLVELLPQLPFSHCRGLNLFNIVITWKLGNKCLARCFIGNCTDNGSSSQLSMARGDVVGCGAANLNVTHCLLDAPSKNTEFLAREQAKRHELAVHIIVQCRLVHNLTSVDCGPKSNGRVELGMNSNTLVWSKTECNGPSSV